MTLDPTSLAKAIVDEMKAQGHEMGLYPETHARFVAEMIVEREERAARRRRIEEKVAGSLVLSMIVGLVALLGSGFLNWIHKG